MSIHDIECNSPDNFLKHSIQKFDNDYDVIFMFKM